MLIPVEFHQITIDSTGDSKYVKKLYKHIMPTVPIRGNTVVLKELKTGPQEFLVTKVKFILSEINGTTAYVELLDPTETSSYRTF